MEMLRCGVNQQLEGGLMAQAQAASTYTPSISDIAPKQMKGEVSDTQRNDGVIRWRTTTRIFPFLVIRLIEISPGLASKRDSELHLHSSCATMSKQLSITILFFTILH